MLQPLIAGSIGSMLEANPVSQLSKLRDTGLAISDWITGGDTLAMVHKREAQAYNEILEMGAAIRNSVNALIAHPIDFVRDMLNKELVEPAKELARLGKESAQDPMDSKKAYQFGKKSGEIGIQVALMLSGVGGAVKTAAWTAKTVMGLAGRASRTIGARVEKWAAARAAKAASHLLHQKIFSVNIDGVTPQRILVGDPNKVAIIGRPMGNGMKISGGGASSTGVLDLQAAYEKMGIKVETYKGGTLRANYEFQKLAEGFPNGIVPDDLVVTTKSYKQNVAWAEKLRNEGYTVIDLGQNGLPSSPFYDAEVANIFGNLNQSAHIIHR